MDGSGVTVAGKDDYDTISVASAIVGVCILFNMLLILLPSIILNGSIVMTFLRTKSLHTPSNLLSVNISISVLAFACIYWPVSIFSIQTAVLSCDCTLRYVQWILTYVFRLTLYSLDFVALAVGYFVILKYGFQILTVSKVIAVIMFLWIVAIVSNVPMVLLLPPHNFTSWCEAVCLSQNTSDIMSGELPPTLSYMNLSLRVYIIVRNLLFTVTPILTVAGLTGATYCVFRKSIVNPSASLSARLMLLPFLMTTTLLVFVFFLEVINWHPTILYSSSMTKANLPIDFTIYLISLLWDLDGIVYACLTLYFNVTLRRSLLKFVSRSTRKCFAKLRPASDNDNDAVNEQRQATTHNAESTLRTDGTLAFSD